MNKIEITDSTFKQQIIDAFKEASLDMAYEMTKPYIKLMSYYKCAMMQIETKFNILNEEYSFKHDRNPISAIKTRLKAPRSITEKLKKKNLPINLASIEENIHDVAGIRVVCNSPEDVYSLAKSLLSQDDITLIAEKDYIANPKPNGYRSYHMIVSIPIYLSSEKKEMKVEIQLRTIAMDFWATLEHQLRYKKDVDFTDDMADELYQCAQISADLDLRMEALRKKVGVSEGNENPDSKYIDSPLFLLAEKFDTNRFTERNDENKT
jgi:putative GTP pyrophosphokinase